MNVHVLKIWPPFFEDVSNGVKTFEVRRNDRDYQVGDIVVLKEYHHNYDMYTGREVRRRICYLLDGYTGIAQGFCIFGIEKIEGET